MKRQVWLWRPNTQRSAVDGLHPSLHAVHVLYVVHGELRELSDIRMFSTYTCFQIQVVGASRKEKVEEVTLKRRQEVPHWSFGHPNSTAMY
jgi:hypothetical protein